MPATFHIILHQPEIPQNTGSIGRLCVNNGAKLHLIHPLGFETTDYYLRRAGLDYWERLAPTHYESWVDFLERNPAGRLWFFSTKGTRKHTEVDWMDGDGLVFGRETTGLPEEILEANSGTLVRVPMLGDFHRSLNLAQTVAIGLYEGLRQTEKW